MASGSAAPRISRAELRHIKVKVTFAPEQLAPKDDIPTGTVDELVAWVGRSDLRAKRVLAREIAARSPRLTLVDALYTMLRVPAS